MASSLLQSFLTLLEDFCFQFCMPPRSPHPSTQLFLCSTANHFPLFITILPGLHYLVSRSLPLIFKLPGSKWLKTWWFETQPRSARSPSRCPFRSYPLTKVIPGAPSNSGFCQNPCSTGKGLEINLELSGWFGKYGEFMENLLSRTKMTILDWVIEKTVIGLSLLKLIWPGNLAPVTVSAEGASQKRLDTSNEIPIRLWPQFQNLPLKGLVNGGWTAGPPVSIKTQPYANLPFISIFIPIVPHTCSVPDFPEVLCFSLPESTCYTNESLSLFGHHTSCWKTWNLTECLLFVDKREPVSMRSQDARIQGAS